jgi:hypothetical protein
MAPLRPPSRPGGACRSLALVIFVLSTGFGSALGGAPCPGDVDGSGDVAFPDLVAVLSTWGPCPGCPEDVDGDGSVTFDDLLVVLSRWGACPFDGVTLLQLAGNGLGEYPHFEYVRAFNEGATVEIAIDPRFLSGGSPGGTTCDVYIVAARTETEWLADRTLVDVRGAPQTAAFGTASIQDNTFVLTDSATLDADAGIGIGVGYDMVCDCNQDATLNTGDLVDGLSDEAGLYVVHDLTEPGPLATTSLTYAITLLDGTPSQQRLFYPTDLASLGPRPIVIIGHGGGHQFTWYDYLQGHLASYGYIVISHPNSFSSAVDQRVLLHTDALIGRQKTIAGGALSGLIDDERIVWIGHSLGGRAALLAYDDLFEGDFVPVNYGPEDVKLLSGIASNSLDDALEANPHDVPFHLLFGSADGDISGAPQCDQCQPFRHVDRAAGFRQSTYVHGADHNDFNCCGFQNFTGPPQTEIGRQEAQRVAKAVYLCLIKHYAEDNIPAKDYLWRQWERFRPIGVAETTTVVNIYTEDPATGKRVIDDYQTGTGTGTSSSGGAVTFDVANVLEDRLDDRDTSFTWLASDPMNGMTYGGPMDVTRGVVFDWARGASRFMQFDLLPADRDVTSFVNLSFRACQGTRHPQTIAELADLTFTVTLADGTGGQSAINIGAFGGGIEEPYQRTGSGAGVGWQNEFETIRIRLTDFLNNGSPLDLSDVRSIRFVFGTGFGSAQGRIGLDDLELTTD